MNLPPISMIGSLKASISLSNSFHGVDRLLLHCAAYWLQRSRRSPRAVHHRSLLRSQTRNSYTYHEFWITDNEYFVSQSMESNAYECLSQNILENDQPSLSQTSDRLLGLVCRYTRRWMRRMWWLLDSLLCKSPTSNDDQDNDTVRTCRLAYFESCSCC